MKALFNISFLLVLCNMTQAQNSYTVGSPDKTITVQVTVNDGKVLYNIQHNSHIVLQPSFLGIVREEEDFSTGLSIVSVSETEPVKDNYTIRNGKRIVCTYTANKRVFHLKKPSGNAIDIIFQVSDDGVAFRYYFPATAGDIKKIKEEATTFHLPRDAKAWLQPMDEAKSGWSKTNPSYEESYQQAIPVGTESPAHAGWVFPALFQTGDDWLLITEAAVDRNYCASRLQAQSVNGEYHIGFPDPKEVFPGGNANPESSLPWLTPWRVIAIGSLQTIVGSTLGTDLAKPAADTLLSFVQPGKASWSWILLKDDSTVYSVQKKYIDYAADMHWQYCLIDADWDRKIGYDSVQSLVDYAGKKNVGIWLWYNSSGDWNTTVYTPKSKLLTHEDRMKEFTRLQQMGVKGIKIDFFGGDGQSMMNYYIDIIEDAAKCNLMVNCHGATLPRGWERTYPNLMTMEAIKGYEMITFDQKNADAEPTHAAMQPFTRNVFDPMDFTPLCLYRIPRITRRTTPGFELALSVVFTSGIQHFAESPGGMEHVPLFAKDFLRKVPVYWDETKLIDGYPGKLVVIARRHGKQWYVAGINGENIEKIVSLDLSFLYKSIHKRKGTIITDGDGKEDVSLYMEALQVSATGVTPITIKGNGGFVAVFE